MSSGESPALSHCCGKKVMANNNLLKCAALLGFTPRATKTQKATTIHPSMAWFKSFILTNKQDVIYVGSITALLFVKKRDKVAPVSLITLSADHPDAPTRSRPAMTFSQCGYYQACLQNHGQGRC
jgi:hypothetical protein